MKIKDTELGQTYTSEGDLVLMLIFTRPNGNKQFKIEGMVGPDGLLQPSNRPPVWFLEKEGDFEVRKCKLVTRTHVEMYDE